MEKKNKKKKPKKLAADQWSQRQYNKAIVEKATGNHIWLNAFSCVRPTPKFCEDLGREILSKLNDKDNLIPSSLITSDAEPARDIAKLTPMLYLSINKS